MTHWYTKLQLHFKDFYSYLTLFTAVLGEISSNMFSDLRGRYPAVDYLDNFYGLPYIKSEKDPTP